MPAVKMKSRACVDSAGGHNLHVCRKSCKTVSGLLSQVQASQYTEVLETSIQNAQDDASIMRISPPDARSTEAGECHNFSAGASAEMPKFPSSSSDPAVAGRMGSPSLATPTILETIFSPILEDGDMQLKQANQSNSVRDDEQLELPYLVADDSDEGSLRSSSLQTCNGAEFYSCDPITALPFDEDLGIFDATQATYPDYEHTNDGIMLDMSETCMILPFLEKTVEASKSHGNESFDENIVNSDQTCLYLAIHQMKPPTLETDISCPSGNLMDNECFDQQLIFRNLPDLSEAVSSIKPILLPKETRKRKPITLVLDLDETLVHSTLEHCEDADFTFPVSFNMKQHMVYVRRRPYLQTFLETVAQMFEIVIFTASQSIYAEQLLDILDPEGKLISQRIYRESCIFSDGSYTKDLTVLGLDLAKVAIVDNSPQVFRLQVDNGIPIKSWFDDPSDHALMSLLPFLETLADAEDVRPAIANKFGSKE